MKKKKICVVGAGIGGMTAAWTLAAKGHEVTVYERGRRIKYVQGYDPEKFDDRVGGKCFTQKLGGQVYELGACSVSPMFKTVIKHARRTGVRLRKRVPFYVRTEDDRQVPLRQIYWPLGKTPRILLEMARYCWYASLFHVKSNRAEGYQRIPQLFHPSFRVFCEQHGLTNVMRWAELPVTAFGYGDLEDIPTWYVMDYLNPVNFLGMGLLAVLGGSSPVRRVHTGYEDLVTRMSEGVELSLRTRHQVVGIERRDDGVQIQVRNLKTGEELMTRFDGVVVATPLTDLKGVIKDLDEDEAKIVAGLKTKPYTIVTCHVEEFACDCALLAHNLGRNGHVALIERCLTDEAQTLTVCYIPDEDLAENVPPEELRKQAIQRLKQDLAVVGADLRDDELVDYKRWNYFTHLDDPALFDLLRSIQGRRNTWYVGGITKFELAEPIAAQAERMMDLAFEGKLPRERFTTLRNLYYFYVKSLEHGDRSGL